MEHAYKPKLLKLDQNQQDMVDKYALVTDTETGNLLVDHLRTQLINDALFGAEGMEPVEITDERFRGLLDGLQIFWNYVHERAELMRNANLQP